MFNVEFSGVGDTLDNWMKGRISWIGGEKGGQALRLGMLTQDNEHLLETHRARGGVPQGLIQAA